MGATKASTEGIKGELARQARNEEQSEGLTIAQYLDRQKPAIMSALPRNVDVDRFTRIVLTAVRTTPRLLTCNPMSLLAAVMQAAQLGLEPGNGLNEAHLVPYGNDVSFQIGYRGAVKLATNSDTIQNVYAEAVYDGEHFKAQLGTDPKIDHVPVFDDKRGTFDAMVAVYAVAKLANGAVQFVVMGKDEIEKHRDRYSKAASKKDSPWQDPLGAVEMAKKTAVLRLSKLLPLSAEVSRAFAADGAVRHELSSDMAMMPDVDEDTDPSVIGAVAASDEAMDDMWTAECTHCGATTLLTADCTDNDAEAVKCSSCGETGFKRAES